MPAPEEYAGQSQSRRSRTASKSKPWFGNLSQSEFEIEFFEQIVARNSNYVLVLRCLGELLSRKGMLGRALQVDRQLVALVPGDCIARYNLACSLAKEGSHGQAIEELGQAIVDGYCDFGHLEVDPDLDCLRNEPAYKAMLKQHGL